MTDNLSTELLLIIELSEIVCDKLKLWCFESADHANQIKDAATQFDVLLVNLLILFTLLQVSEGLGYIFGQISYKIDFSALFDYQKGFLVDELGIERKILQ